MPQISRKRSDMSSTFTLTGHTSSLSVEFETPIFLDPLKKYAIGLLSFDSYHTIPNIDAGNNKFRVLEDGKPSLVLEIPNGGYDIKSLTSEIQRLIRPHSFQITVHENTSKIDVLSSVKIGLGYPDDFGRLLGIRKPTEILPDVRYTPIDRVNIRPHSNLEITCNLVKNSYRNADEVHSIHSFAPLVPYGYKIVEKPMIPVYYPIGCRHIQFITCSVVDHDDKLVSFQGEKITIQLHLKEFNHHGN